MSETIEQICQKKGVKLTDQRKIIAKVLSESKEVYGESDHPDVSELMAEIWYELNSDVNLSVAEPVEKVEPAIPISTGESKPSESDSSEIRPSLTLPLVGTIV